MIERKELWAWQRKIQDELQEDLHISKSWRRCYEDLDQAINNLDAFIARATLRENTDV